MTFRLEEKSRSKALTYFRVLDERGSIYGSINIPNEAVSDFLAQGSCACNKWGQAPECSRRVERSFQGESEADESSSNPARLQWLMSGDDSSGWSAMAKAACWLERVAGISVELIARAGLDRKDSFTLVASGRQLSFQIRIDGGWVGLYCEPMDGGGDALERLLIVADGPLGWEVTCALIQALERSGINKLQPAPLNWVSPGALIRLSLSDIA